MEEEKTSVPLSWLTECRAILWGLLWWELQSLKRWKQNHLDNLDLMHIHHVTWFKSYTASANFVQIPPLLQTKHKHNLTINLAQFRTVPCQLLQQLQLQTNVTPETKLGTHQNISSCVLNFKIKWKIMLKYRLPTVVPTVVPTYYLFHLQFSPEKEFQNPGQSQRAARESSVLWESLPVAAESLCWPDLGVVQSQA